MYEGGIEQKFKELSSVGVGRSAHNSKWLQF